MKNKSRAQHVFHLGNGLIRAFFYFLMIISLFAALASDNWVPDAGNTTGLTFGLLLSLLALGITPLLFPSVKSFLQLIFIKYKWRTSLILLALALIWQLQYVYLLHPAFGFDVSAVRNGLLHPNDPNLRAYFSVNYNNLPLLITLHKVTTGLHSTSWLTLDLATTIITDFTAGAILASVAISNHEQLPSAFYIVAIWLALFPTCMVPYTDIWSMLPLASSLLFWTILVKSKNGLLQIFAAWLAGAGLAVGVWLKPSTGVWGIALVLTGLLYLLKNKRIFWTFGCCALFAAGFAIVYQPLQTAVAHQKLIQVNPQRAIPWIHFIDVGLTHDGAYDPKAALQMDALPSKSQKIAYSQKQIKKRLQRRGFWGYLAFLVKKQGLNSADGTFGWLHEGHFIVSPQPHGGWRGFLANFSYPQGKNLIEFRIMAQIFWTLLLLILSGSWQKGGLIYQTLRLAIVGVFIFLLIFEGGRSRYLVQLLPVFLVLAALSTQTFSQNWQRFKKAVIMSKE